ncbi:MAG: hypothetical protein L6R36_004408, partial [Xanthoria steineri]
SPLQVEEALGGITDAAAFVVNADGTAVVDAPSSPTPNERHRRPLQEEAEGDITVVRLAEIEVYEVLKMGKVPVSLRGAERDGASVDVWMVVCEVVPEGIVVVTSVVMVLVAITGLSVPVLPRLSERHRRPEHEDVVPGLSGALLIVLAEGRDEGVINAEDVDAACAALPALRDRQSRSVHDGLGIEAVPEPPTLFENWVAGTGVVEVATPGLLPALSERQSKPVQEVAGPTMPEPPPSGAEDGTTVVGGVDWVVKEKVDEVEGAAGPLSPRPKDKQRSPVQGTVVAVVALLMTPAVGDKIKLDTAGAEAAVLPAPSERQSRPVQEVIDPGLIGMLLMLLLGVCPEAVAVKDPSRESDVADKVLDEDTPPPPVPPKSIERQSSPEQEDEDPMLLGALLEIGVATAIDVDPDMRVALDEPSSPNDRQSSPVQGEVVVVGLIDVLAPRVVATIDNPNVELALGKIPNEALTQRRSGHPKGRVELGLAGGATRDVAGVADNGPVPERLRQRRSVQLAADALSLGNGFDDRIGMEVGRLLPKVACPDDVPVDNWTIDDTDWPSAPEQGVRHCEESAGEAVKARPPQQQFPPLPNVNCEDPAHRELQQPLTVNSPVRGTIAGVEVTLLVGVGGVVPDIWQEAPMHKLRQASPEHEAVDGVGALVVAGAVFGRETVQPARFKQAFTQRSSVHVAVDTGGVGIVDGRPKLPVEIGFEVDKIGDDGPGEVVELASVFGRDTVQPTRFKQAFTQRISVHVAVDAGAVGIIDERPELPVEIGFEVDKIGDDEPKLPVRLGFEVARTGDDGLEDVVELARVFGRETVQPARFKQAFTQSTSLHVVVDAGAVGIVDGRLGLELFAVDVACPCEVEGLVPGPEPLFVKDTVQPSPRFRQAFTHKRSVQVAVVLGPFVVGSDAAEAVLGDCVNADNGVVMGRNPDVLVGRLVDPPSGLLGLGSGAQVGPTHRLRQSAPEHEGVGVKRLLVVLETDDMLEKSVRLATVDGLKVNPEDMMVGNVPENADDSVDKDVVDTDAGVLVVRLLIKLPEFVGFVTALVGLMVEQPSPVQRVTHAAPSQDVVIENDKLVDGSNVADNEALSIPVELVPGRVDTITPPFELVDTADTCGVEGLESTEDNEVAEKEVDTLVAEAGKIKDEMVGRVVIVVQVYSDIHQ